MLFVFLDGGHYGFLLAKGFGYSMLTVYGLTLFYVW